MTENETIANRVASDLVTRANADRTKPIGVTVLIAAAESAAAIRVAMEARWKTMLAAYSSGIAHADQDVDTRPASATLAQLQKVGFVVVTAASELPATVALAYATVPVDDVWRSALERSGAAIVVVSNPNNDMVST